MTVQELVEKAERLGFKQADVVTGARVYHNQPNIYRLTPEQVADLDRRMTARAERVRMAQGEEEKPAPRAQAARNLKRA
jgi:DNA-binding PadR family transcriptional regulator